MNVHRASTGPWETQAPTSNSGAELAADQLMRYAQDLSDLLNQHALLQHRYQLLLDTQTHASANADVLLAGVRAGGIAHLVTDGAGLIRQASAGTQHQLGRAAATPGRLLQNCVPAHQQVPVADVLNALQVATGWHRHALHGVELGPMLESGQPQTVHVWVVPMTGPDGTDLHWLFTPRVAGQTRWEALLALGRQGSGAQAWAVSDAQGRLAAVNLAFTRITGFTPQEVLGQPDTLLEPAGQPASLADGVQLSLHDTGTWTGERLGVRKDGREYPAFRTSKAVVGAQGELVAHVHVWEDITQRTGDMAELSAMAYHDALTGLPNRRLLEDRVKLAISLAKREGTCLSLLFLDLDGFKPINDSLGHDAGDVVLREVAHRLSASVRQSDTVARLGGDEFVVVLNDTTDEADVRRVAEAALAAVGKPMEVVGQRVQVTASVGCARFPLDGGDLASLLECADQAMYEAKRAVGSRLCLYAPTVMKRTQGLEHDVWHAIERGQLHLVYQPQVSADGEHRWLGCEALLRWTHPEFGEVAPRVFIPLAEKSGAIGPLGDWVLATACRQLVAWHRQGHAGLTMAVNITSRQLRDADFPARLQQILAQQQLDPSLLELEISEAQALQCLKDTPQRLLALRAMGVRIAVDDFGATHTAWVSGDSLPIDRLKVDRYFVQNLSSSSSARALSQCFRALGQSAGLQVLAGGVESHAQLRVLQSQGYAQIQGFLTASPMRADTMSTWIKERSFPQPQGPETQQ